MNTPELATEFCFTGQFLELIFDRGKAKYIRLAIADREALHPLTIKLTKQARAGLVQSSSQDVLSPLRPQEALQIIGIQKLDRSGQPKWKAHRIQRIPASSGSGLGQGDSAHGSSLNHAIVNRLATPLLPVAPPFSLSTPAAFPPVSIPKGKTLKILTCRKSGCTKKGGNRQCQVLQRLLGDRGLAQQVTFEETGCLGKCSMAPNLVLMPGKKRLSGMKPEAIVDLIERLAQRGQGGSNAAEGAV